MTLNLYMVTDSNYDWCCFAFDTSRNRAKLNVAEEFDYDYTEMRCKTLKKGCKCFRPNACNLPRRKRLRHCASLRI